MHNIHNGLFSGKNTSQYVCGHGSKDESSLTSSYIVLNTHFWESENDLNCYNEIMIYIYIHQVWLYRRRGRERWKNK